MSKTAPDAVGRVPATEAGPSAKSSLWPTVARAAFSVALIAIGGGFYGLWTSGGSAWTSAAQSDQLSATEQQQRRQAFAALGPLALRFVDPSDLSAAIDGMGLTPGGRQALIADLEPSNPDPVPPAGIAVAISPAATASGAAPLPLAVRPDPTRLAWITLWDTDVEDGDVVRIDSEGYSRTVVLTKRGTTFAVPVSGTGTVTVTGLKDGDGGGITVGLASGGSRAVFPIMSTGQSLGLAVTMR